MGSMILWQKAIPPLEFHGATTKRISYLYNADSEGSTDLEGSI